MAAQFNHTTTSLPQGFSVYQSGLGQALQFFPAVGTQELDQLISAYLPGPATAQEKRASISLDFLEHSQLTGQAFKFYAVYSLPSSAAASSATASPLMDSGPSSFAVSPMTPTWDFSQVSTPASTSRRSSTQPRHTSNTVGRSSRHQTASDFSHIPGMKIMTRDGMDVTNSASRGSKTKEQRDHAHLMRIIKACESCKKKKIRCDPSHKKRSAAPAATIQTAAKTNQKAAKSASPGRPAPAPAPAPVQAPMVLDDAFATTPLFGLDPNFSFSELDESALAGAPEPWEKYIDYYPPGFVPSYDFLFDSDGQHLSLPSFSNSSTSSSSSPDKSYTPASSQDAMAGLDTSMEAINPELQTCPQPLPFLDDAGVPGDYKDFNLYSPASSFSEDERMLPLQSSSVRLNTASQPSDAERLPPAHPPFDEELERWLTDGSQGGAFPIETVAPDADAYANAESGARGLDQLRSVDRLVPGVDRLTKNRSPNRPPQRLDTDSDANTLSGIVNRTDTPIDTTSQRGVLHTIEAAISAQGIRASPQRLDTGTEASITSGALNRPEASIMNLPGSHASSHDNVSIAIDGFLGLGGSVERTDSGTDASDLCGAPQGFGTGLESRVMSDGSWNGGTSEKPTRMTTGLGEEAMSGRQIEEDTGSGQSSSDTMPATVSTTSASSWPTHEQIVASCAQMSTAGMMVMMHNTQTTLLASLYVAAQVMQSVATLMTNNPADVVKFVDKSRGLTLSAKKNPCCYLGSKNTRAQQSMVGEEEALNQLSNRFASPMAVSGQNDHGLGFEIMV